MHNDASALKQPWLSMIFSDPETRILDARSYQLFLRKLYRSKIMEVRLATKSANYGFNMRVIDTNDKQDAQPTPLLFPL